MVTSVIPDSPQICRPAASSLREFFVQIEAIPAWVDRDKLRTGARALRRGLADGMYIARDVSLLGGCQFSGFNKTLLRTGALEKGSNKRFAETMQWAMDVISEGGLAPLGVGYRSTIRVRLPRVRASARGGDAGLARRRMGRAGQPDRYGRHAGRRDHRPARGCDRDGIPALACGARRNRARDPVRRLADRRASFFVTGFLMIWPAFFHPLPVYASKADWQVLLVWGLYVLSIAAAGSFGARALALIQALSGQSTREFARGLLIQTAVLAVITFVLTAFRAPLQKMLWQRGPKKPEKRNTQDGR
jgi:hypothetical protein